MPTARLNGHELHYNVDNTCVVIRPEGACDEHRTEALAAFANSPLVMSKDIILDLSHAEYVESPGFRWIVRQMKHLETTGRKLIVAGAAPNVERAYRLLHLDKIAPLTGDVSAAMEMLDCTCVAASM